LIYLQWCQLYAAFSDPPGKYPFKRPTSEPKFPDEENFIEFNGENVPKPIRKVFNKMLSFDPGDRPSAEKVYEILFKELDQEHQQIFLALDK